LPEISDSFVADIRRRLEALGIESVVIGAVAASRYRATPRETTDVDLLARSLVGVEEAMRAAGFAVHAVAEPGSSEPYVVFIRGEGVAVDILLAETAYQETAMDRAVGGVITVEDVIIHKLLAWRPRDRADIESIFAQGHELDERYIESWVDAWGVRERWETAKRELR